ncbi:hypothetical protein [Candidatus Thiosymbion oneisti]|uniref:hypothetical protein n=1 Tax=Candidatus Thiosymbion oneisti TaxID=589554 RepID=UPI001061832F|nr:hypothetical protein [Candidatus Thiosymbion oneisti]
MKKINFAVWLPLVGLIAVCCVVPLSWAEDPAKPADKGVSVKVDDELPPIEIPPEILDQLNGMASESSQAMAEVTRMLSENIADIKDAEAIFDRMIQTIRKAAANGAPDSQFVTKIEKLAALARTDAAEARQLGNMEKLAEWFTKQAADFEEAKGEAIAIYTSSFKKIREIEREKQRFVLAMKVKQYGLARQNINKGLEVLRSLDEQIGVVYDKLPAPEAEMQ